MVWTESDDQFKRKLMTNQERPSSIYYFYHQNRALIILIHIVFLYSCYDIQAVISTYDVSKIPTEVATTAKPKIHRFCLGTENSRSQITVSGLNHYQRLKRSFINCERIIGNLEITHVDFNDVLDDLFNRTNADNVTVTERVGPPFYFFKDLVEISGYLLIFNVNIDEIAFPKLRIILGEKTHEDNALQLDNAPNLRTLNMPELRIIENGNITIRKCPNLCQWNPELSGRQAVDFSQFLGDNYETRIDTSFGAFTYCTENSALCHENCEGSCFGSASNQCQTVYRRNCDDCPTGSCYRVSEPTQKIHCCHESCSGGCFGSGPHQCAACKRFQEDGKCVEQCRGVFSYNSQMMIRQILPNEEQRYFYGRHCTKTCPPGMLIEDKYCVARCSPGYYRDVDIDETRCMSCNGPCPKVCQLHERIDSNTIKNLVNCTEIEGNLEILGHIFDYHLADRKRRRRNAFATMIPPLDPVYLNVLKTVRVVTGHVVLDQGNKFIEVMSDSLDFLENLEMIEGRNLYREKYALYVVGNPKLKWLGLKSLRKVKNGVISFRMNRDLCYGYTIPFRQLIGADVSWAQNVEKDICEASGRRCDATCDSESGCWGPGPQMCVKCKNFIRDGACSETCPTEGYFISRENSKTCLRCHEQCTECFGTRSTDCRVCRGFEHWTREIDNNSGGNANTSKAVHTIMMEKVRNCVSVCPNRTYAHEKRCEPCHKSCYEFGCTGPHAKLGDGGCNRCRYAVEENNEIRCLSGETEATVCHEPSSRLPLNYVNALGPANVSTFMCRKCPSECKRCTRESISTDACECADYALIDGNNSICVSDCGKDSYIAINQTLYSDNITVIPGICMKCHEFCDERFSCTGVAATDCERCAVGGIAHNNTIIECLKECPPESPVPYEGMCYDEDQEAIALRRRNTTIGIAIMSAILFALIISYLGYRCTKYRKKYEKEAQMHLPEIPALDPRKVTQRPNMRRLNLIAIDELDDSKNNVLGQGAFGIVYAGKWKPPNRKDISIPVAIKVINKTEARHTTEAEMMKEAGMMASIQHEHLLPLVGICVAKDGVKIVTILRPLGSLLKFLKEHKDRLGSKSLMLYCYQISSAMEFLARKKIVHRDLATRNVLVKNINHVEVTDFGLAQMLQGCDTSVIIDGRVAVKWLAIESLRQQIYTERTDVWSFGVTCWEILTFGGNPYNELRLLRDSRMARDLACHLEKGYRLIQPTNCSQELYQELLNCWLGDPDSRPSFRQLKEHFDLFCRAPHIYIQERRVTQRMDSITSSEQRQMIERLLQDTDFLDPVNLDPADYSHSISENGNAHSSNFFTTNTMETTLPPNSPCTPTRPLMGSDQMLQGSVSTTNSSRYKSDPMARRYWLSADDSVNSTRTSETEMLDDENYLMPRSIGKRSVIGRSIDEMPDEEERERKLSVANESSQQECEDGNNVDYLPTYLNELDVRPETIPNNYANSLAKEPVTSSPTLSEHVNSTVEDSATMEKENCDNVLEKPKNVPYMNVQQCESAL